MQKNSTLKYSIFWIKSFKSINPSRSYCSVPLRGEISRVNDLDFLIIKEDVPLYGLDRMRELDELIDRNLAADMLVYRPAEFEERIKLGDPFIKTIVQEGRILYG